MCCARIGWRTTKVSVRVAIFLTVEVILGRSSDAVSIARDVKSVTDNPESDGTYFAATSVVAGTHFRR